MAKSLQWRHNDHNDVWNNRRLECLLKPFFQRNSDFGAARKCNNYISQTIRRSNKHWILSINTVSEIISKGRQNKYRHAFYNKR